MDVEEDVIVVGLASEVGEGFESVPLGRDFGAHPGVHLGVCTSSKDVCGTLEVVVLD